MAETYRSFFSAWQTYLIFGMIFGSFLNVVICRVPDGISLLKPASRCPKCGHLIKWYENIPVISWIFLMGKCSSCGAGISAEYPIIELGSGLLTAGLFLLTGPVPELAIYIALLYTLLPIMVIDYKTFSIPHGLNITFFIISVSAVFMHHFISKFLPVSYLGSFAGGLTGLGLLYLIHKIGKIVYKQDAMGMGDIFLLGSAGLMLGPKLTVTAFILGSLLAVISYAAPSVYNHMKRKSAALSYLKKAEDGLDSSGLENEKKADILGIKLQLLFSMRDGRFEQVKQELLSFLKENEICTTILTRLFFRFAATDDCDNSVTVLRKLETLNSLSKNDIKEALGQDLVGYDSYTDNLKLLRQYSKKNGLNRLQDILSDKEFFDAEEKYTDCVDEIYDTLKGLENDEEKLSFLLKQNRYFQYNGYTAEQKQIIGLIETAVKKGNDENVQRFLSDTALVYFKDFFFRESGECVRELLSRYGKGRGLTYTAALNLYNIALFRYVFFKQRLAFGPFLAAGIMISLLWGEKIINAYFDFLEELVS